MKAIPWFLLGGGVYVLLCISAPELAMAALWLLVIAGPWIYGALRRGGR